MEWFKALQVNIIALGSTRHTRVLLAIGRNEFFLLNDQVLFYLVRDP
jgi:hypothetical protein